MSNLPLFLQTLAYEGRATVAAPRPITDAEVYSANAVLLDIDANVRLNAPGNPPPLDTSSALWGAVMLYRACQFAVFRDIDSDEIERHFATPALSMHDPSAHYAVDLTFRFLPQVALFAQRAAESDALVICLKTLGRQWPLSSIGMAAIGPVDVNAVVSHPSLLAMYVDRVVSAKDLSRLDDARVREAVATALGAHSSLAAEIAAKLAELQAEVIFLAEPIVTP